MPIVLLLALILRFAPMHTVFEYNVDEGIELARADLLDHGFTLYSRTYDDQPPLFTALIPYWWRLAGKTVDASRLLVFLFTCVLVWAFYNSLRLLSGKSGALAGSIFLLSSLIFLRLGVSFMAGIPSLALAMVSVYCLVLYQRAPRPALLAISAAFLALSMHIKFFTAFLVLPCLFWLAWTGRKRGKNALLSPLATGPWRRVHLRRPLAWLATLLAVYAFIVFLFFHPRYELFVGQLFKPHMQRFPAPTARMPLMALMAAQDIDIVLLAGLGLAIGFFRKKAAVFFPFSWLCLALFILSCHRPVWNHYYVLLSIPLCWLAGTAVGSMWKMLALPGPSWKRALGAALCLLFLLPALMLFPYKCERTWKSLCDPEATPPETKVIETVRSQKQRIRWLLTDRPIFAFRAGVLTPPQAPIYTEKARSFFNASLLDTYTPEMVLWAHTRDIPEELAHRIAKDYRLTVAADFYQSTPHVIPAWPKLRRKTPLNWFFFIDFNWDSPDRFVKLYVRNDIR
jgi:4-amino-4-deoxy-L-arabinose transferase-like glycosyltransferase